MKETTVCGIDFGTSNSAIALGQNGKVHLTPVEEHHVTLPSAIFYPSYQSNALYGRQAQTLFFESEEGRFMRSLKRLLGTSLMGQGTLINGKLRKFDDILIQFIRYLKQKAETHAHSEITSVVMGRPVHFVDSDAKADALAQDQLEAIAKASGFRHIAFQFEPIAAAYAHERQLERETLALVVDIGGGTSDLTLIKIGRTHQQQQQREDDILANTGGRIGGNDFDKYFSLSCCMPTLGYGTTYGEKDLTMPIGPYHDLSEWAKINFLYTPRQKQDLRTLCQQSHSPALVERFLYVLEHELGHKIMSSVETAKIALTEQRKTQMDWSFIESGLSLSATDKTFNAAVQEQVARISQLISDCLAQAGLSENDIEMVILTGGPTEMPVLKNLVKKRFPAAQLSEENKLSSVAVGLGYDSCRRFQ